MTLTHHLLGRVEYQDGLDLQRQFQDARRANAVNDTLFTLEHPPVLTLGRGAHLTNIITPKPVLEAMGIGVFETDRGGDVTYHGPGQLVGYPILYLPPGSQDVRKYVRRLEEAIIRTVGDFGITATRIERWPGVWVEQSRLGGPRKICALGVHLSRWYTRHGFALNVKPNLSHFETIVACGIAEAGVTSMVAELGHDVELAEVEARVAVRFAEVFEATLERAADKVQTVAVAAVSDDQRVLLLKRTAERGGFWQIVTGSIEQGESAQLAAHRELDEETGLRLKPESLSYQHSFVQPGLKLTEETGFVARVRSSERGAVRLSAEHDALEWVTPHVAYERLPFEGLREVVRRALSWR